MSDSAAVKARHEQEGRWCRRCKELWPCDAYQMAERCEKLLSESLADFTANEERLDEEAKKLDVAEQRVRELEALPRTCNHAVAMKPCPCITWARQQDTAEATRLRVENERLKGAAMPRFDNVSCSQCGNEFGPGNEGFSHCSDHRIIKPLMEELSHKQRLKNRIKWLKDNDHCLAWDIPLSWIESVIVEADANASTSEGTMDTTPEKKYSLLPCRKKHKPIQSAFPVCPICWPEKK